MIIFNYVDNNKQLGGAQMKNLRYYRKALGLSQEELAKAVGISRYSILDYENSRISPTIEVGQKIAEVLKVSLDDLIDSATNPTPPPAGSEALQGEMKTD